MKPKKRNVHAHNDSTQTA